MRMFGASAAVSLGLLVGLSHSALGAGASSAPQTVVVQPGDTIWSIASSHYKDGDLRERVYAIEQLNHLDGPTIAAGEELQIPRP